MYNLRTIAMMLVQTPLGPQNAGRVAGAPFQMPYTLELPIDPVDRWRVHLDLFEASKNLVKSLIGQAPKERHAYLRSLRETDERAEAAINAILDCNARPSLAGAAFRK
jgi:hypothetical protein